MHNKKTLLILSLTLLSLTACGGGESSGASSSSAPASSSLDPSLTIHLFNADSRLIGTPKPDPLNPAQSLPMVEENILTGKLPTYRHKDKADVPYVSVKDLAKALGDAIPSIVLSSGMTAEAKDDGYHFYSSNKKGEIILDAEKDIVKVKNGQYFGAPILSENNNIAGDYCAYRGNSIRESDKTKIYLPDGKAVPEYDTFDFRKYNFDIVLQGGECYVPLEAFSKVLFRDVSLDLAYNGADFYTNVSESSFLASWVYSSKGVFQGLSGIYEPSKTKGENEAYRFQSGLKRASETDPAVMEDYTRFLVLNEDGHGFCQLCKGTELNPSNAVTDTETEYSYSWKKVGEVLQITVQDKETPLGTLHAHLDETRFLSGNISSAVSSYNYDVLRFVFDTIYGLKDIKKYDDATAFFKAAGVDEGLKSNKPDVYTDAFSKLIGYIDDGHSSFNNLTPYVADKDLDKMPAYSAASRSGTRVTKLVEDYKKYMKSKMETTKRVDPDGVNPDNDPNYYQGLRFSSDKETAIISFNGFANNADQIPNMAEQFPQGYSATEEADFIRNARSAMITSSTQGFNQAFKILDIMNKTDKVVKNVVVDLSTNGGGEIAIMPYLTAFFSDDPTYVIQDVHNKAVREYHYKVDLNGDGTFGGAGDTYKGKFNFYFLTSNYSFSCGNCLPGMVKEAGVKIIGERSGGGTSPVGVYFDALGTYFNLSNHYDMSYKVDGKYVQNDGGIDLDHAFPFDNGNWYDPNAVNTFLKTLNN